MREEKGIAFNVIKFLYWRIIMKKKLLLCLLVSTFLLGTFSGCAQTSLPKNQSSYNEQRDQLVSDNNIKVSYGGVLFWSINNKVIYKIFF